jgi:hypothetical protein
MTDNRWRLEAESGCLGRLPKAGKHWGSGVPLPPVASLQPPTNQEVASSSLAGPTKLSADDAVVAESEACIDDPPIKARDGVRRRTEEGQDA